MIKDVGVRSGLVNPIDTTTGHVCHIDFAKFIFTKGTDSKVCIRQQAGLPFAVILPHTPDASAAEITIDVKSIKFGILLTTVNKAAGDGAIG